jgi:TolB-like protein
MADVLADLRAAAPAAGPARVWRGFARVMRRPRTRALVVSLAGVLALAAGAVWFVRNYAVVGAPRIDSLAVLPFRDIAGKPEQEYFADGMQEALIAELGKISGLRVISHQSTVRYRGSDRSVPEIARELNVQGVVTASVFRDGDNVHLRVHLIDAFPEERPRWSQTFQDELRDVLTMHSAVARAIAHEVRINLTANDETRLATTHTVSPETYEAYLRGMHELNKSTPEGMARGLAHFEAAVERHPADPLAYTGLALGYVTAGHAAGGDTAVFAKARAAAERALKLDPTLADVHVALANLKLYHEWDWAGFEAAAARVN